MSKPVSKARTIKANLKEQISAVLAEDYLGSFASYEA